MTATLPAGIGNDQQALQATAFIREQPWYKQFLVSTGRNPGQIDANGNPAQPLSEDEQSTLLKLAQDKGIGINEDDFHIDENGQIAKNDSHWLRNSLIASGIAGSMFIPGVGPAVLSGLSHAGSALGTAGKATLGVLKGAGGALAGKGAGAASSVIGAGSKIAGLLGVGEDTTNALGNSAAQRAQAETNNRFLAARTDQAGPSADTAAFRNEMRAGLVARMDPKAAPLMLGDHALPSLANADTTDYAKTMFNNLRDRQAAGKTPTEFGVPDASAKETEDANAANTYGKVGVGLNAGSKILNLLNLFRTNTDTSGGGGGYTSFNGDAYDDPSIF